MPWNYWSLARDENVRFKDGSHFWPSFFAKLLWAEFVSSYNFLEHPATLSLVKRSCAVVMSYVNCWFVPGAIWRRNLDSGQPHLSFWSRRIQIVGMDVESSQHNMTEAYYLRQSQMNPGTWIFHYVFNYIYIYLYIINYDMGFMFSPEIVAEIVLFQLCSIPTSSWLTPPIWVTMWNEARREGLQSDDAFSHPVPAIADVSWSNGKKKGH